MSGVVHVPWYATGFRGDQLQAELERVSALSVRYGATHYTVYRGRDDRYKFLQVLDSTATDADSETAQISGLRARWIG